MTQKNFGPAVSGYLDPDGRNFETVVFQAGKPVLDKELSLGQDIDGGAGQLALRRAMPSGWLSTEFLDEQGGMFVSATAPNIVTLSPLTAHLTGWIVTVTNTGAPSLNQITLPAAPVGAGVQRTDVVVLEVWRKLLSAAPSTDGKSFTARIWRNGNVKVPSASDAALNFIDDILDTNVGSESTKRVQIQYRLRVLSGVDLFSYPYALNDPSVVANAVPTAAAAPDGIATTFPYTNQAANDDAGLWRAGDGNPTNTLGTVDGYMYAVPLLGVFRRNQTAFDRNSNQNGAGAFGGPSGRPDGLFYDLIDPSDVVDLRTGVSPTGWNYAEVLAKAFQDILDNASQTEWITTLIGGGVSGPTVLWNDEIGVSTANGGDNIVTGSTPGGPLIGEFDAARRVFSDRAIQEVVTIEVPVPGGGWVAGVPGQISIDPSALPIYPYAAFNWSSYNPAQVLFTDIVAARWTDTTGTPGLQNVDAMPYIASAQHVGEAPIVPVTMTFLAGIGGLGLTTESLFVDVIVSYPPDGGLSNTPVTEFGAAGITVNNPGQLPAGAPVLFSALASTNDLDFPHREVQLQYTTLSRTITFPADTTIAANPNFIMPERVDPSSTPTVLRNAAPLVGSVTIDATGRVATFTNPADYTTAPDVLTVTYSAIRPLPQNNEQLSIWYWTRAPQTARSALLGTTITVTPRLIGDKLHPITVGSGSPDESYPYPYAYVQTGGIYPSSGGTFSGEHQINGRADIATATFNAQTGFLQLPVNIPYVPSGAAIFNRAPTDADIEGRTFFKSVPGGAYVPNAYAQDLSDQTRHKVVLPFLVELSSTSLLGWPGQLALMLLVRYADFDEENNVVFNPDLTQNTTSASIFRIRGNLLNNR